MAGKSRGRGVTAAVGWLLLCAGVVGAIALVIVGERRYESTITTFARAQVGCVTTLRFTDPGTFYVYEETGSTPVAPDASDTTGDLQACVPTSEAGSTFSFTLTTGAGPVRTVRDRSITYEQDGRSGESYSTFEVESPVTVDIVVSGPDINTVAAVGHNPVEARDEMRRMAVMLGVAGVVLGALLLVLSGRKSRRAASSSIPDGPGWSRPIPPAPPVTWPPTGPSIAGLPTTSQQPINPHLPDRPVGSVAPGEPWPSPTQGLLVPSAADPLPRRLPTPHVDQPTSADPPASELATRPTMPPFQPPTADPPTADPPTADVADTQVALRPEEPQDRGSETAHDGDDATED